MVAAGALIGGTVRGAAPDPGFPKTPRQSRERSDAAQRPEQYPPGTSKVSIPKPVMRPARLRGAPGWVSTNGSRRRFSDRAARAFAERGYAERAYPDRGHYERATPARDEYDAAPTVRRKASAQRPAPTQPRKNSLYDELDAIAGRIARATRGQVASAPEAGASPTPPHAPSQKSGIDSIIAAVTAETEKRTRESTAKTTEALDSVVRWIERTEERMNESNRSLSDTARMALERQDHTANVLGEALAMMTKRLDEIEGKVSEGHQPAMNAALQAVAKGRGSTRKAQP